MQDSGDRSKEKPTKLEDVALRIYGSAESPAYKRWVDYWNASRERNKQLLEDFERIALLQFEGCRVLDIGCGTGGLGDLAGPKCKHYVGGDFNWQVLQFCRPRENLDFVQCNGIQLPFADQSYDLIFAFDVVEHLLGGKIWQSQFLRELRRILSPLGMILFTTPNYWYPYDAHTDLYFPQFLPRPIRDYYIERRNPEFLKEHTSFDEIRLMKPGFLKRAISGAELAPLHDLPCCLDQDEYRQLHPVLGLFSNLGMGWYFHAEFWLLLVHKSERDRMRLKLRKNWFYEQNQPASETIQKFHTAIDFDRGSFNHQLGSGWYWHERSEKGFRWTCRRAEIFLESDSEVDYLCLEGYSPENNGLKVYVDGIWIGEHSIQAGNGFRLRFLLPFKRTQKRLFSVVLKTERSIESKDPDDNRELGLMIFSLALS